MEEVCEVVEGGLVWRYLRTTPVEGGFVWRVVGEGRSILALTYTYSTAAMEGREVLVTTTATRL